MIDQTETIIRARRFQLLGQLPDLWRRRGLAWTLAKRDISVRYKQTLIGVAWAVVQPVMLMIVFSVVFGKFGKIPSDGVPYPVFSYSGLLPWLLFASSLSACSQSIVSNAALVTKVYVPRLLLPIASTIPPLVEFVIAFAILIVLMIYFEVPLTTRMFWLPAFLALAWLTALSVGIWLCVMNVFYRDFRFALPFMIQVLMFLTPVIYPSSMVGEPWSGILALNPMMGVVEGFRWALLGVAEPNWSPVFISIAVSAALLVGGLIYFERQQWRFADVI